MTQQWQLSGNAENVDWSDISMAGRAYADNLVGEPAVSKVMHMMADEIERLRAVIRPESYEKSDEKRVFCDTTSPRNGAPSGCETVPDPDSRVWETPCTPQPHATPPQGSVQGEGSFRDSRNSKEPVAWAVIEDKRHHRVYLDRHVSEEFAGKMNEVSSRPWTVVPLYRHPQPTLTDEEREAVRMAIACCEDITYGLAAEPEAADTLRKLLARLA